MSPLESGQDARSTAARASCPPPSGASDHSFSPGIRLSETPFTFRFNPASLAVSFRELNNGFRSLHIAPGKTLCHARGQYNLMKTMNSSVRPPLLLAGLMLHLAATCALAGPVGLPEGPGSLGAYQTRLAFTPEWDAPWRVGPRCDVVVRFDHTAGRLVFWHGANYVPCWVNEAGQWYSDGAVLRPGAGPQQDRLCRFAFASAIESSDARVVVRWRYAPVDAKGELIHADPVTRWNDWVDECYTIYPDASGVRSVTLHSSEWSQPYWVQQSTLIRQPGEPVQAPGLAPASHALTGGRLQTIPIKGGTFFHAVAAPADNADWPESWGDWPARGAAAPAGHEFIGALRWEPSAGTHTR